MVQERIVDDAQYRSPFVDKAEGNADERKSVNEVGCSVCINRMIVVMGCSTDLLTDRIDAKCRIVGQRRTCSCSMGFLSDALREL
jgi:hypothetical protein